MPKVNTLSALAKSGALSGKRVFIRADLNVPFDDAGRISEDTRIRASVPGIRMALDAGAAVMVTSHLGRPKEGVLTEADSLAKVGQRLSELLGMPVQLVRDWVDGTDPDDWTSVALPSPGVYGVPEGLVASLPVHAVDGKWEIVEGLEINEFSRSRIDASVAELVEERRAVEQLGLL